MSSLKKIFQDLRLKALRKKHLEFKQALTEFSRSLTLIVDLEQLKDNIISKIREIIKVEHIFIYLLNADLNRFQLAKVRGFEIKNSDEFFFQPEDPLIRWFAVNETHLIVSEKPQIFSFFNHREQELIKNTNIDFIFPLVAMNRVTGLVCLGQKSSGAKFNREEIELLTTLLGQVSLAFENAYLYQQQKARLKKMYRADRLATLGQLAAGAAHEIRNPLTSIRSTIQ
ncbi:MAG TPA: GAF domain-containing protein, partial [bacterium]